MPGFEPPGVRHEGNSVLNVLADQDRDRLLAGQDRGADRVGILVDLKTASSARDVPMPDFVREAIVEHAERFKLGDNDVLGRTAKGTLFRRDYHDRYVWKPAGQAVGLMPDTTFHDLRHTFASTALAEGVPISEVSRWRGHKSITTTVDL